MATAVIVAGYFSDALNVDTAWALGAGIIAAYAVSRGLAKAGHAKARSSPATTTGDRSGPPPLAVTPRASGGQRVRVGIT